MEGFSSPFDGFGSPFGQRAVASAPLFEQFVNFRAKGADYAGGSIVGEGVTLAPATGTPVLNGGMVQLDGADLVGAVSAPLNDLTVVLVARATGGDHARDALSTLSGPTGAINIEAQVIGAMYGRMRAAGGYGFGSNIPSMADVNNDLHNRLNELTVHVLKFDGEFAYATCGEFAGAITPMTGNPHTITSLIIGRDGGANFIPMDFVEVIGLEGASDAAITSAVEAMRQAHGAGAAYVTPILETVFPLLGDSNTVGVGGDTIDERWARRVPKDFVATTFLMQANAGAQGSTFGLVSPADDHSIAASYPVVTQTASTFTGSRACIVSFGTNDYGNDVPIGTPADATNATFHGGLNIGTDNLGTNAPADMVRFFVTIPPRYDRTGANAAGHTLADYNAALAAHVAAQDPSTHVLIDLSTAGLIQADIVHDGNPADFLHYGDVAHGKIADVVRAEIARHFGIVR